MTILTTPRRGLGNLTHTIFTRILLYLLPSSISTRPTAASATPSSAAHAHPGMHSTSTIPPATSKLSPIHTSAR